MKWFRKVNRGLLFTILVLLIVIVYMITLTVRVKALCREADSVLRNFLQADSVCQVIPEEYRTDCDAYLRKIEPDLRPYFANDDVYAYYIDHTIRVQYSSHSFYESYRASIGESHFSGYENAVLDLSCFLMITVTTEQKTNPDLFQNGYRFSFRQTEDGLQIYYLNYTSNFQGDSVYE